MPLAYMHVHSSFERDNNMHVTNGRACARGTRVYYLLSERPLATLLPQLSIVDDSLQMHKNTFRAFAW